MFKHISYFFVLLFALLITSCSENENSEQNSNSENVYSETLEDKVIKSVTVLPEYHEANELIQSMTNGEQSVSAIIEEPNEDHSDYIIQVGYNKERWFEPLYFFYVNPSTLKVSIEDIIVGDVISLEEWRKREDERYIE